MSNPRSCWRRSKKPKRSGSVSAASDPGRGIDPLSARSAVSAPGRRGNLQTAVVDEVYNCHLGVAEQWEATRSMPVTISARVPPATAEMLRHRAAEEERTVSDLVSRAVDEYLRSARF